MAVGIKGKLYGSYRQTGRDASGALWGAFTEAGEKQQVWWETGRTEWTVALIDERGAVQLLIDLYRNKVEAAQPGKAREFLYDILSANGVPVTTTVPTTASVCTAARITTPRRRGPTNGSRPCSTGS